MRGLNALAATICTPQATPVITLTRLRDWTGVRERITLKLRGRFRLRGNLYRAARVLVVWLTDGVGPLARGRSNKRCDTRASCSDCRQLHDHHPARPHMPIESPAAASCRTRFDDVERTTALADQSHVLKTCQC